ncbi:MAG TPA: ChbG/HpnK family deacetylase, partial [Tepidisphaeraceae bacterium]|nr:ChbG/HpnK family deacetylase [Tepidisphaeraceae bacterium]
MAEAATEAPVRGTVEPGSIGVPADCLARAAGDSEKMLVVNADDFGRSAAVNHATLLAYREGILTSASLMVSGVAAGQAVEFARQNPTLAVGLHLVLADGVAALPAGEIPHLVDGHGNFRRGPGRAGIAYFFSRSARRELAKEIRAQFEQFARTGLALSHVDGHCHLHLHPVVFDLVLPLAEKYEARAVRIVRDGLGVSWFHERRGLVRKLAWQMEFSLLGQRARRR